MTREAMLFEPLADSQVRCLLCAHGVCAEECPAKAITMVREGEDDE